MPSTLSVAQHEEIDERAEREASALTWMHFHLDIKQPAPRHRMLAAHAAEAAERDLPLRLVPRYPLTASLRAHAKIEAAFRGRGVRVSFDREVTTRADRERRAAARKRKAALLRKLQRMPLPAVPRQQVAKLLNAAERTIYTAVQRGELPIIRTGSMALVPVPALCSYLSRRIA